MMIVSMQELSLAECAFLGSNVLAERRRKAVRRRRSRVRWHIAAPGSRRGVVFRLR